MIWNQSQFQFQLIFFSLDKLFVLLYYWLNFKFIINRIIVRFESLCDKQINCRIFLNMMLQFFILYLILQSVHGIILNEQSNFITNYWFLSFISLLNDSNLLHRHTISKNARRRRNTRWGLCQIRVLGERWT